MAKDNSTKIVITAEDKASAALKAISTNFDAITAGAAKVAGAFTALTGLSFAGVSAGVVAMVRNTADAQDEMGKMAQKAGMGIEALSGLSYAAKLAGADTETLVTSSKALSTNILDAARAADQGKTMFGALGISVRDSAGGLRATDQIMLDVAERFAGMEDGANKSALAVKLFGRSGLEMIPFLNQGKDGIAALTAEAERMGLVMSEDAAKASEQFNDNIERLSAGAEGIRRSIGNAALPMLNELVQQMTDASTEANSLGGSLRSMTSQANIEDWAEKGAYALAFVVDSGRGVVAIFQALGTTIGAAIAQADLLLNGDVEGARAVGAEWQSQLDQIFNYEQQRDKVDQWFSEYHRTVRVNGEKIVLENAETAKAVQKVYDDYYAELNKKSNGYVEFDEAAMKKQDAIRAKYTEDEKRRTLGEFEFKKQKIEEKYEAELTAVRGAQDAAALETEIRKKMAEEISAIYGSMNSDYVAGENAAVAVTRSSAAERVRIEQGAATAVAAVWSQANAVKAAQTGGAIMNQGSAGEFVSSWDANGNYVGELGTSSSSPRGYATGGSFVVGGSGGTDSQLVTFRASPDERVTIETPAQQRASNGGVTVNVNVANGNPQSIIAAIKQALRVDPGLFSTGAVRAG